MRKPTGGYCIELRSPAWGPITLNSHHVIGVWTSKTGETTIRLSDGDSIEVAESRAEVTALMGGARKAGGDE